MTPIERIYFTSRIIHGDLTSAAAELTGQLGPAGTWISFIKTALMALGNLADLEGPMRFLYQNAPHLAERVKTIDADLQFAKYLRNVFGGHLNETLIAKAYEWRPELRTLPEIRELNGTVFLNLCVLETAINTYVGSEGRHGMFSSETDLVYPPDMERFCTWLCNTVRASIKICDSIGEITHASVKPMSGSAEMHEAFMAAGLTDFSRIKKGR